MTVERIGVLAAALVVAGGLAGGFALIGSPAHQRDLELDRRRVADLGVIVMALERRFHPDKGPVVPLPRTLPRDLSETYTERRIETSDPATRQPYSYVRSTATRLQLCATFALASEGDGDGGYRNWPHPAGTHCYAFDIARGAGPIRAGQ